MNRRRFEVAFALAILVGMLAWTVLTGHVPGPWGDFELKLPQNHMIAKPAPGEPRNLEVERSLENLDLDSLKPVPGSILWKGDYGYSRLTNIDGGRDSDVVACKAREAAPWTVWAVAYNRDSNTGHYAHDPGYARFCPVNLGSANNEWHTTGVEFWPVNDYSIRWSDRKSMHDSDATSLEAHDTELLPRDPQK